MNWKKRVWEITESANPDDRPSLWFDILILLLICLSTVAVILETVEEIYQSAPTLFFWFEVFTISVFTLEYLARLWSCTTKTAYSRPILGRIRYLLTPMALIDLMAILPFYLPMLGVDLRFIRLFRLLRIFRLAKAARYISSLRLFGNVFQSRKEELAITSFLMLTLLIISSTLMFFFEHAVQPERFPNIPSAMWWAVATLTTVGYGDVYPVTGAGRFLASVIAIFGIALFALPAGILGAGFVDELRKSKQETIRCPHCGKEFESD